MIFFLSNFQFGGLTDNWNNKTIPFCLTVDPNGVAGFNEATIPDSFFKVERTDFTQNLPLYLQRKILTINGWLLAQTPEIFKQKKRDLAALLRQEFILTIQDKSQNTIFETYEIKVRVISVTVGRQSVAGGQYQLQLTATDPFFHSSTMFDQTYPLFDRALNFPLQFPLVFGTSTTATINNTGTLIYPTYYLTGSGTSFIIANQTTGKVFKYTGTIPKGQTVIITAQEDDPIKARLNGQSVNSFGNNFEALQLAPGNNVLAFGVEEGLGADTSVRITFKTSFNSI